MYVNLEPGHINDDAELDFAVPWYVYSRLFSHPFCMVKAAIMQWFIFCCLFFAQCST